MSYNNPFRELQLSETESLSDVDANDMENKCFNPITISQINDFIATQAVQENKQIQRAAMESGKGRADKFVTLYATEYIINETSVRTQVFSKPNSNGQSNEYQPEEWRRFRRYLFGQVRQRLRRCILSGESPDDALKNSPPAVVKLAQRYNLIKLAVQVEASNPQSVVSDWALSELVSQLARVAGEQCRASRLPPRALPPRLLAPAVAKLQREGVRVRCTRAELEDVWHRLCSLKSWQLYGAVRRGDVGPPAPRGQRPAELLAAHDWRLLDTLLLYDPKEELRVVTPASLQSLESYRSLVLLVSLLARTMPAARPAGPVGRAGRARRPNSHHWALVHHRYTFTGRSATIVLLQRRWYHLLTMARAARDRRGGDIHPLLQLILREFEATVRDTHMSWIDMVYKELYVPEVNESISKELWRYGERRRHWIVMDYKKLEKLETVEEIDEYLKKRLNYCEKNTDNEALKPCVGDENCSTNMTPNNLDVMDDKAADDSNDTNNTCVNLNNTSEGKQDNARNEIDDTLKVNNTDAVPTVEALKRIDPSVAKVTVVFESDSDEETFNLFDDELKLKENEIQDSETDKDVNIETEENEQSVSIDMSDVKKESKELKTRETKLFKVEDQAQWMQHTLGKRYGTVIYQSPPLKIIGREQKEDNTEAMKVIEKDDSCEIPDLNISKSIDCTDDTESSIDTKLLCMTSVKLTRIDENPAWVKHAYNNSIDVKWVDLHEHDSKKLLHPVKDIKMEDASNLDTYNTSENVDETRINKYNDLKLKPELHGVSQGVLSTNEILLSLCKPVCVRMSRLQESEIPRRGRMVKRVELADIDEVRRINKNILTAEVKPISLHEQNQDSIQTDEDDTRTSTRDKYKNLSEELELLDRDIKRMFQMSPAELEAVINEAVNTDDLNLITKHVITSSNVFLDQDDEDEDETIDIYIDSDDNSKAKEPEKESTRKRKRTSTRERNKKEGKEKNKKRRYLVTAVPIEEPKLDAYEEWQRQKNMTKKYFNLGNGNGNLGKTTNVYESKKRKIDATETKEPNDEQGLEVTNTEFIRQNQPCPPISMVTNVDENSQGLLNDNYLAKLLNAPSKSPNVSITTNESESIKSKIDAIETKESDTEQRLELTNTDVNTELIPQNQPRPPISMVTKFDANLQGLLNDSYLAKLLNAPPREPNHSSLKYILSSPMQTVVIDDDEEVKKEDSSSQEEVTPTIAAVCSLADTQIIDDAADDDITDGSVFNMPKTNAEMCKNNRKKAEKIRKVKKTIKTGTEITRTFRLQEKMHSQVNESSVTEIVSIPSTSRIRSLPTTLATTSTRPDVSTASSTGTGDHGDDNLHDSFLSTSTHDNRNSIIVQAEVHMNNSPVLYNHTSENTLLADVEQNRPLQAQETIQRLADAPNVHIASTQDVVHDEESDLFVSNQDTIMDQELPPPDGQAIHSNSRDHFTYTAIDKLIKRVQITRGRSEAFKNKGIVSLGSQRTPAVENGDKPLKKYYYMTPEREEITVRTRTGACQKVAITKNVLKVKVSSNSQATDKEKDNAQSLTVIEPKKKKGKNSVIRKRKLEHLPPILAEPSAEVTTPQEYIKTDYRTILTVLKFDTWDAVWTINNKYIIVTEEYLPSSLQCERYWTVDRYPPGPCQLLVWNEDDTEVESNEKKEIIKPIGSQGFQCGSGNDADKSMEININDEALKPFDSRHMVYPPGSQKISKSETNKSDVDELIMKNADRLSVNERDNELVIDESNEEFNANKIKNDGGINMEVDSNETNRQVLGIVANDHNYSHSRLYDENDPDSDSECNRLQIVESEELADEFPDIEIANELTVGAESNDFDNVNTQDTASNKVDYKFTDHTYSKSKDTDKKNRKKSMIKVKSFASVSRMHAQRVMTEPKVYPDIKLDNNKVYKKLVDKPIPTYALILSVVPSVSECDRLLRAGVPLQVCERRNGFLEPLGAVPVPRGPAHPIRLSHIDPAFLAELVETLNTYNNANPSKESVSYFF